MQKFKIKLLMAKIKAQGLFEGAKEKLSDTTAEGYIDTAIKIIIGVVIGALVLAGLLLLWNNVIMPRLNTEVNNMFNA